MLTKKHYNNEIKVVNKIENQADITHKTMCKYKYQPIVRRKK